MAGPRSDLRWKQTEFRLPAFRATDLRLIGDMCSDPLTKAIRNHVPAFRAPVWSDDARQVLVLLGESRSDAVSAAIRRGALRFVETLD